MFWYRRAENKKRNNPNFSAQRGFTFLEIAISLLVLSVGAVTMLQTINFAMNANYRAQQEIIASNLASALLSEIMSKSFEEGVDSPIGREGLEVRTDNPPGTFSYDDVDDYDSTTLPGGVLDGPTPVTVGGSLMNGLGGRPNYPGFVRAVSVIFVNPSNVADPGPTDYKRITVTVNGPSVNNFQLEALRSLY